MKVTISLDFDYLRDDIRDVMGNRLEDLGYTVEQIELLMDSFDENIDGGFMDATFEIEFNDEETEVTSCVLVGG